MDTLIKKYKLRYQLIESGYDIGDEKEMLKAKYDHQNQCYFREMEKIHGKHWKKRFDAELQVLDSMNQIRIKQQDDSLRKTLNY